MSLEDLGLIDYEIVDRTLLLDGDIICYRPCCIFNDDDSDMSRRQVAKYINMKIDELMKAADCNEYIFFVTTKFNFRDDLVDDYKANRNDTERPVNLAWAKRWCVDNLNTHFHKGLEADDLLGIHMTDDTVLWSLDKDLRQIPGKHLDDDSLKVVEVTNEGVLRTDITVNSEGKKKKKHYFDGTIGLYFQMLTGDSTDHILGCGKRVDAVYKSGAKKGESYIKRQGVGPGAAIKLLDKANSLQCALDIVVEQYKKVHNDDWQEHLETQANLLFMVREQDGEIIKRWTYDGRDEYFDMSKGEIVHGQSTSTQLSSIYKEAVCS